MKATKTQLVDFIYNNFQINGKKIPKKKLNTETAEKLMEIVTKNKCEKALEAWINKPKMIKFFVDGIQDGAEYSWDCEYLSEKECKKAFNDEGIKIVKIATAKGNHRCKYCGSIAFGTEKDLLCDECREMFGHTFYSEL